MKSTVQMIIQEFCHISLQLTYILLDVVILELFPELNKVSCTVCILMLIKNNHNIHITVFYIHAEF